MRPNCCFVLMCAVLVTGGQCGKLTLDGLSKVSKDKECYGTHNRLSRIGNTVYHYHRIRTIYDDCTYVHGNLEVTHLNDPEVDYDLSFLSQIEVVTGYVLIGIVGNITKIPLTSLKLIKAENTMPFHDEGKRYALLMLGTQVTELQLPSLKEISRGDVMLLANPVLCHVTTIRWEEMTTNDVIIAMTGQRTRPDTCGECSATCEDRTGHRRCWGTGSSMCQTVTGLRCDVDCFGDPRLCHSEGILGCCHPQCAVGCVGSLDSQCLVCRDYKYNNKCVSVCPGHTYVHAGHCVPIK